MGTTTTHDGSLNPREGSRLVEVKEKTRDYVRAAKARAILRA